MHSEVELSSDDALPLLSHCCFGFWFLDAEHVVKYGKGKGKGGKGKGKGVWWVPVPQAYYWSAGKGVHYLLLQIFSMSTFGSLLCSIASSLFLV